MQAARSSHCSPAVVPVPPVRPHSRRAHSSAPISQTQPLPLCAGTTSSRSRRCWATARWVAAPQPRKPQRSPCPVQPGLLDAPVRRTLGVLLPGWHAAAAVHPPSATQSRHCSTRPSLTLAAAACTSPPAPSRGEHRGGWCCWLGGLWQGLGLSLLLSAWLSCCECGVRHRGGQAAQLAMPAPAQLLIPAQLTALACPLAPTCRRLRCFFIEPRNGMFDGAVYQGYSDGQRFDFFCRVSSGGWGVARGCAGGRPGRWWPAMCC